MLPEELIERIKISSVWKILSGVNNDAPYLVIGQDGKIHPVSEGLGDASYLVWKSLSSEKRDVLVGLALSEMASLINNDEVRQEIQSIAASLVNIKAQEELVELPPFMAQLKLYSLSCGSDDCGQVELYYQTQSQSQKIWPENGSYQMNANNSVDLSKTFDVDGGYIDLYQNGSRTARMPVNLSEQGLGKQMLQLKSSSRAGKCTLTYEVL